MLHLNSLKSNVFQINDQNFEHSALKLFRFQYRNNSIYREYISNLNISVEGIDSVDKIPFLPIRFFKSHKILSTDFTPEKVFVSSGTTGIPSKHYMEDLNFYEKISSHTFRSFFGEIHDAIIMGLLPSYLERDDSSLVYMVGSFIRQSGSTDSGFYLDNLDDLVSRIRYVSETGKTIYLFGVTFALLKLAENYDIDAGNLVILETGGMKGTGRELIRHELHAKLKSSFKTQRIYSEYGMTELLSQAYMKSDGLFRAPPWMKVFIRELHDPFSYVSNGKTGVINIIDLANVHSCAFIETEDLGAMYTGGFQVLGRVDNSDLRGCNLMLS
ncbi:MAG: acyl transferase [Cytophagales bacterium]|nr:acyl transferase [Cytophagales bacterium]